KDGMVSFGQAIGEKAFVEVKPADDTGYINGCLGFTASLDGKNYWISYQWEAKKETTVTLDMNKPFQLEEIIGTETEAVTDEEVSAAIIAKLKKEKSALLQVWYACDKTGKQIDPPASAAESVRAYVLASTDTETTAVTSSESDDTAAVYGDANLDGRVTVADAVAVLQHIANRDKFALKPQGLVNADVDGSEGVTANDALVIQKVDAKEYSSSDLPLNKER
ncbi:MAG: dockerin type I repeat-containing protein, partial [Ruminococcus sp.]|nr:dockerin type I repeat-containing protein [Ruminococcus sp.]